MIRTALRLSALAATVAALGACSLLSSPDPVQLYRFGGGPVAAGAATSAEPVEIALRRIEFAQAVRSERILGVTGTEAAYISGARWVSPAPELFTDALESAFAGGSSRVRLLGPREITPGTQTLDIDVRTFEARYAVKDGAPTVVVIARARLLNRDRTIDAEETFESSVPAGVNRVSSIVDAFDAAVTAVTGDIVAWTEANAGE
ncbi:MAG: ABC-type transport auxiliary lipoprotein family protein [Pseudomonadota bacterium]